MRFLRIDSATAPSQRLWLRWTIALACTVARRDGAVLGGETLDVGYGGMSLALASPLGVDELVAFELVRDDGVSGTGHARVRWCRLNEIHGMRFEHVTPAVQALVTPPAPAEGSTPRRRLRVW